MATKIEKKIVDDFGFTVPVCLKTSLEIENVVKRNPFPEVPAVDYGRLHVTFLAGDPPNTALELLRPLAAAAEQFHILGREIYLYCPNGYGNSKLSNAPVEKKLSVGATTRNWKTVNTLLEMAQ